MSFCVFLKHKGLDLCCNLFTPKAKMERKKVTLVTEPVCEGLQFAHQHSYCWAVWNGAPGILNVTTGSTGQAVSTINQGY